VGHRPRRHGQDRELGGIKKGIKHVEDPQALGEYQLFHVNNYSHMVTITFEPLVDMEAALAPIYAQIKAEA
jgi:hypothetical protein